MKADNRVKVADSPNDIEFPSTGIKEININHRRICLIKKQDQLFACDALCPHAGAPFESKGFVNNQMHLVCCVHNYRFHLKTGRDVLNEGYFLKVHPVEITDFGVFISLKDSKQKKPS